MPRGKEVIVAASTLALLAYTLALSVSGQVLSSLQTTSSPISNKGAVMTIGVGIFWDNDCTDVLSSIDWGLLEPGTSKNVTCYVRNEGNSASILSMYTSNWNPSDASDYMTLSWDYGGQTVNLGEVVQVTFTLSVSASIDGITDFSFDITIAGSS